MTETKEEFNWNKLAEKGDDYGDVKAKFTALESDYCKLGKEKLYDHNNEFTKEFEQSLEIDIAQMFESTSLTPKEIALLKNKFLNRVKATLDFVVLKKGLAQITFSQYPLYRFFEAFNTFVDEVEFTVSKDHIRIIISDSSRIAVIKAVFCNDSYKFLKEGTISINIEDFKGLLKCTSKDQSIVTLLFAEEELEMSIRSEKRNRTIVRKLNAIDFELQEMPIDTLNAIKYPFEFEMTKDDFLDLMGNIGRYSEILGIETIPAQVKFSESSDKGSAEIDYKKTDLPKLTFLKDVLDIDSEVDQEILDVQRCVGYYSLTFLGLVKSFCNVLDSKDKMMFSLKTSHPLKTQITFKKLTNTSIVYYLAPRVDEKDDDEDEDFEPTELEEDNAEDDFEPFDSDEE